MQLSWIFLMTPPSDGTGGASGGGGMLQTLIMFGTMAFIFYFMIYRPQKKRTKERAELLSKMEKGDKVKVNGMHGTIASIEDDTVLVQVAEGTKIRFDRAAVTTIVDKK
jgi:preprotein translocase subunit YajC